MRHENLHPHPDRTLPVAILLILAAGMLDAYTYVGHGGVFANAMTGNIVVMVVHLVRGDISGARPFLAPVLAYLTGVATAHAFKERPLRHILRYPALVALGLEIAFLAIVGIWSKSFPSLAVITGIAFVAALQATSFTRIDAFAYTSVTTSANLRHFAESLMAGFVFRDGRRSRKEALVFFALCACFILGALSGAWLTGAIGGSAVWLPVALLSAAMALCLPWNAALHCVFRVDLD